MLPLPKIKITRMRALFIAAVLLTSGLFVYYYLLPSMENKLPKLSQELEVAKQDSKIKVTSNTDLVQKIMYLKCGDEEVLRTKPADNLVGLNYTQMQRVYSGWAIDKFDTKEVVMTLKVDGYCREHANNMFIGLKDGYVAVYCGRPGPKAIVKETTSILVANLTPQDVAELEHGLLVQSREELLQTLEGLQSR